MNGLRLVGNLFPGLARCKEFHVDFALPIRLDRLERIIWKAQRWLKTYCLGQSRLEALKWALF